MNYSLKALSKDNKELVDFTLGDGPCIISDDYFVLTNRPNTPILQSKRIFRGLDIKGLYEGDILDIDGKEYTIRSYRGFAAVAKNSEVIFLNSNTQYRIKDHSVFRDKEVRPPKLSLKYKVNINGSNKIINFNSIMKVVKNKVLLNHEGGVVVNVKDLKQYAEIRYKNEKMFFGDTVNNYTLRLYNGSCCFINKNNNIINISKGEMIK